MRCVRPTSVLSLALITVAFGRQAPSWAAEATRTVALSFEVPAGCPTEEVFLREFRARAPSVMVTPAAPLTLHVAVERTPKMLVGEVTLGDRALPSFARRIEGRTCVEVVSALALISAITLERAGGGALDGEGGRSDASGRTGGASPPAPPPTVGLPGNDGATVSQGGDAGASSEVAGDADASQARRSLEARERGSNRISLGVGGDLLEDAPAPVAAAVHAFAGGVLGGVSAVDRVASWDLRARLDWTLPVVLAGAGHPGAVVHFERVTAGIELCPVGLSFLAFRASVCGRSDFGLLFARSNGVPFSRDAVRPWGDAGLGIRVRADIAGPLFAGISGYALAPLERDRYIFAPDATVYRAAWLTGAGSLELGVSF